MTIAAVPQFSPEIPYAGGPGCLVCTSNVSAEGAKVGTQAVDLGTGDEFMGAYALCYDCAIQVARVIGFVPLGEVWDDFERAWRWLEEGRDLRDEAVTAAAQSRLDKDTVERIVGPYAPTETAVEVA